MRYGTIARDAAANAVVALIDAAGAGLPGRMEIYSGTRPVTPNTAPSGTNTKLATLGFSFPAFGAAGSAGGNAAGTSVAASITAASTGVIGGLTASWFRLLDGNGTLVMDGTILVSGSLAAADMYVDDVTFVSGATVSCSLGSITVLASCV